ncbi:restriction endonuclease subunit S [Candidatus Venteria ishoeyi]|uniref:EcoKI restriction-modification system protein HsdS n=1 Tax=Candidatus Venteria ishoeyi TaxID=1899563 RepID=A0A1H6FF44_9GAMM|nr:restriction endonuclease subunit S [Candidatus Venteria ishoeyi]SEH08253.1 EcoKI restriction-modification system protein HsdS [Candidatus Venteria ishoeyi]
MNKPEKKGLVPELRFPEFLGEWEWHTEELGCKTKKVGSGITPKGGDKNYTTEGRPFVRSQNIGWGCLILNDVAYIDDETHSLFSATEIKNDDVLLNITGASIGRSAVANQLIEGGNVNQHVCIIRTKQKELNPFFLNQFLISQSGQNQIDSFQAGGNRQGLNFGQIRSFSIPMPLKIEEQQKIADCLTAIDELITAQTQKLDTLKTHKKGLMQQLFPAEGETLPKLRFPEFQSKGEWRECSLGTCLSRKPEYGINAPAVPFSENLPAYLRITDISENGNYIETQKVSVAKNVTDENYLYDGDIVLARTGASVGKSYKYRKADGMLVFAGFLIRIRPDIEKLDSELLFQFLSTERYWRWVDFSSARSGQPGINGTEYASLPISLPPSLSEQQKIANCLTSLDALITAQAEKIDTLKTHKKGLMQQLFPTPEAHG